jgi:TolA-binding protein
MNNGMTDETRTDQAAGGGERRSSRPLVRAAAALAAAACLLLMGSSMVLAASDEAEQALTDAQKLQKAGKTKDAAAAYERFLTGAGDDERAPWVLVQLGDLHAAESRVPEALGAYARVVKKYPDSVDARLARSRMTQLSAAAVNAARDKMKAARTDDERQQAQWEIGTIYEWGSDVTNAALTFREIKNTARQETWRKKAEAKLNSMVEAKIEEASKGPPVPDEDRWVEIATLAETAEIWGRAAEFHLKIADLVKEPEEKIKWRLKAADDLRQGGQVAKALDSFLEVLKLGPAGATLDDSTRGAGAAYETLGRWADAMKLYGGYLKATSYAETSAWAWLKLANTEQRTGQTEAALRDYHSLAGKYAKNTLAADALLAVAKIAEDSKDFEGAKNLYGRVDREYPDTPEATEAKVRLLTLPAKAAEWAKVQAEISKMSDKYSRRERKEE